MVRTESHVMNNSGITISSRRRKLHYGKYILKRLGYIIIVFFLLSILLFGIFKMVPGDPARLMVEGQKQSVSPEQYEMLYQQARVRLGLDKPIPVQYLSWMGNILQGDFGYSTVYRIPVKELIGPPMKNTIALNVVLLYFPFRNRNSAGNQMCGKKRHGV